VYQYFHINIYILNIYFYQWIIFHTNLFFSHFTADTKYNSTIFTYNFVFKNIFVMILSMFQARIIPTSSAPNSATTSRDELLLAATFASIVKPSSMSPHSEGILRATLTLTPTPRPRPSDVVTDTNTLPGLR
jgi:hypothetical protein